MLAAQAVPVSGPKSTAIDFAVKTFDCLLEQSSEVIARRPAGAWTWTWTWTVPPEQQVVKIYLLHNPWINCVEFEFCFRLVEKSEIEDKGESMTTVIPQTGLC